MDPSTSSGTGSNGRQKRVLPSRARRGGPGVGTCDTDVMILEHQKRRFETEAIIPPNTPFLLTTDSKLFSNSNGVAESSVTTVTSERYFDRPDVLKAYREQLTIQTPSFTNVQDNPSVARFRPRGPEDAQIDTSDAAYERRHRKYESFEKRQRLREKEKLQHEQYKLKERIEQLRVMDASAFLALPASHFTPPPRVSEEDAEEGVASLSGAYVNGTAAYNEGERRRKEMLDIALALEERYRVLLPRDRMRRPQPTRENVTPARLSAPAPAPAPVPTPFRRAVSDVVEPGEEEEEEEGEEIFVDDGYSRRRDGLKIKLKLGGQGSASQSPAPTTTSRTSRRSTRTSVPPLTQKPVASRGSRAEPSHSPAPPMSPSKLGESPELTIYPTSEPPPSPRVETEEPIEAVDLRPELEDGVVPPPPVERQSSVSSEHKFEMDPAEALSRSQARVSSSSPRPPTPPQKRSPLPDTRPALAPEIDPTVLEQEALSEGNVEPPKSPTPEGKYSEGSPIRIDEELSPAPVPGPRPVSSSRHPTPLPTETLQNVPPSPRTMEVESVSPRRPRAIMHVEEGSRLLELANAVHSITVTPPPAKRQKVRHPQSPPKPWAPSNLPPTLPTSSPPQHVTELEQEPTLAPPPEPVLTSVTVEEPLPLNGDLTVVSSPLRPSRPRSPSPPSIPVAISATASESAPPSAGPSVSTSVPVSQPVSASVTAAEGISSISAVADSSPAATKRRQPQTRKNKAVEYRSPDTGELLRTRSLLLIAGIRGGLRQTQRHQTAFGVKVPEEISEPYDFWLPNEYLPEEELMKYRHYDYEVVGGTRTRARTQVSDTGGGEGSSAAPREK